MSTKLLLLTDLLEPLANPYATLEEHESAAARLAGLAIRGARVDISSLREANVDDLDFLPNHVCRWALQESKSAEQEVGVETSLPDQEFLDALYDNETDRTMRLLLVESVLTHPNTETALARFNEAPWPVPLLDLPALWPRSRLIHWCEASLGEGPAVEQLTEFGMLLLQTGTPGALAFLGAAILNLREWGISEHPLVRTIDDFVRSLDGDEEIGARLGIHGRAGRA